MVDIPDDTSTTASLTVGNNFAGQIEVGGDEDWVAVFLEAGEVYEFGLASAGIIPLSDPFLSILDSAGNILASDDDGGTGLNSLITGFTVGTSGTYYISASSFDESDFGQYRITSAVEGPPDFLDSIDWGTSVTATDIKVYFAANGEGFDGETSRGWNAYEQAQAMLAFEQYAKVCNLTFTVTTDESEADFRLLTNRSFDYLGYFNPPGETNAGVGVFSRAGEGWDLDGSGGLEQGGYGFITLVHEFGHGLGLAHPHDRGGDSTKWEGVTSAFDSFGTFALNQGIYSVMSYNDGWQLHPSGANDANSFGYVGGPMAFDIALLQEKYGANATFAAGDDIYEMPRANGIGSYFSCLWDAGGSDTIRFGGGRSATIDLRAAHLGYAADAGGYISFAAGIYGGFTIAAGVVIENALGGGGDDLVTGNDVANSLRGRGGGDLLAGGAGNDTIVGGGAGDTIDGGLGRDTMAGQAGNDVFRWSSLAESGVGSALRDKVNGFVSGADLLDLSAIDAGTGGGDFLWLDQAAFDGAAGRLRWQAVGSGVLVQIDADGIDGADFEVLLSGTDTLLQSDVLL
jgi:serralysin